MSDNQSNEDCISTPQKALNFSACEGENRFRRTVNAETQRLNDLCDRWNVIKTELNLDDESRMEDIQGQIDTAIGQAQLLITKKFKQFHQLIDKSLRTETPHKAFASDLDGFWEMVYIQVEDLNNKFNALQKLKDCNWIDATRSSSKTRKGKKRIAKMKNKKTPTRIADGRNKLREFINATKKQNNGTTNQDEVILQDINQPSNNNNNDPVGNIINNENTNSQSRIIVTRSVNKKIRFADETQSGRKLIQSPTPYKRRSYRKTPASNSRRSCCSSNQDSSTEDTQDDQQNSSSIDLSPQVRSILKKTPMGKSTDIASKDEAILPLKSLAVTLFTDEKIGIDDTNQATDPVNDISCGLPDDYFQPAVIQNTDSLSPKLINLDDTVSPPVNIEKSAPVSINYEESNDSLFFNCFENSANRGNKRNSYYQQIDVDLLQFSPAVTPKKFQKRRSCK